MASGQKNKTDYRQMICLIIKILLGESGSATLIQTLSIFNRTQSSVFLENTTEIALILITSHFNDLFNRQLVIVGQQIFCLGDA